MTMEKRSDKVVVETPRILFLSSEFKGRVLSLQNPELHQIVIGRDAAADCQVKHPTVSSAHCSLRRTSHNKFLLYDLDSTNGTRVNGTLFPKPGIELRSGDVVRIGEVELLYEDDDERDYSTKNNSKTVVDLSSADTMDASELKNFSPFFKANRESKLIANVFKIGLGVLAVVSVITVVLLMLTLVAG